MKARGKKRAKRPALFAKWRMFRARFGRRGWVALAALCAVAAGIAGLALLPGKHPHAPPPAQKAIALPPPTQTHLAPPSPPPVVSKPVETAILRPPPTPPPIAPQPAWLRFARPAPAAGGRPLVAIVLDDLGLDRRHTAEAIRLPAGVTLSFMTYADDLPQQTGAARAGGHEMLVHVPMEAIDRREDPGPHALYTGLSRAEIIERLRWGLGRFDGYIGVNNHMGSRFTADPSGMAAVIAELQARGLVFLDSRTSPKSVGLGLAAAAGLPHAGRDVFLDDDLAPAAIALQLTRVEAAARRRGAAVAIGHPKEPTLAALRAWLPTLASKGLVLAPLSAVIKERMTADRRGALANVSTGGTR
jgi:polysaccharide deacetylase 2 family uncharacterized protein YibQ